MTFRARAAIILLSLIHALPGSGNTCAAADHGQDDIHLDLSPRVCTLAPRERECRTTVHANWQAARSESLCLIVLTRSDVKQCWENYDSGTYSIELTFSDDLTFELRDRQLHEVLASEILRVIREAIQYRHRRRQPWNIFD